MKTATEEAPYEGPIGRTRSEAVHLLLPDGTAHVARVYRGVNVGTDPALRDLVGDGGVQRVTVNGETFVLAVPLVLHDPEQRKFAVVVPEALRHEALQARAEVVAELADDVGHALPRYVRECAVVVGSAELGRFLREAQVPQAVADSAAQAFAEHRAELESREAFLRQREDRLSARAEVLTAREDDLRGQFEEAEARERELAMREEELGARISFVREREAHARSSSGSISAPPGRMSSRPPPVPVVPSPVDVEELVDEEEVAAEVDEYDALYDVGTPARPAFATEDPSTEGEGAPLHPPK